MEIVPYLSFYKGKKIFITGHTGFKGAWMLAWLSLLDCQVKGYALESNNKDNLFDLIEGDQLCESIIGDIRDQIKLEKEIVDFQPDLVFHLAAQPLVRLSYEDPINTYSTNIMGTINLLEGVKKLKKKCAVILITTDKVYENREWEYPYRESDPLGGYDPYSSSKAASEIIISSYRNSFFNLNDYLDHNKSLAVGRAGNVIGGGDWSKDRLIPDLINSLQSGSKIILRNPNSIRPWQHVLEPIKGYLKLGEKLFSDPIRFSHAYNFGPYLQDTLTVSDLVKIAINIWGKGEMEVNVEQSDLHEAGLLKLDISKSTSELDWHPKFNSYQAIENTILWYKVFLEKGDLKDLVNKQIAQYTID